MSRVRVRGVGVQTGDLIAPAIRNLQLRKLKDAHLKLMCSFMAIRINIQVNYREHILGFVEKVIVEKDFFFFQCSEMGSMKVTTAQENLNRSPVDKTEYIQHLEG